MHNIFKTNTNTNLTIFILILAVRCVFLNASEIFMKKQ